MIITPLPAAASNSECRRRSHPNCRATDYELELVTSYCAPLYWAVRDEDGSFGSHNGTAFFLDAGEGLFAVTACHLVDGWNASRATEDAGPLRLAGRDT
jgi:hypothetical protein